MSHDPTTDNPRLPPLRLVRPTGGESQLWHPVTDRATQPAGAASVPDLLDALAYLVASVDPNRRNWVVRVLQVLGAHVAATPIAHTRHDSMVLLHRSFARTHRLLVQQFANFPAHRQAALADDLSHLVATERAARA